MRREHHVDYVQEPAVLDKDDSLAMSNLLEKMKGEMPKEHFLHSNTHSFDATWSTPWNSGAII